MITLLSLQSNRHTTYNGNDWKLPQKHARKMDRFLNKNSLHGTAISTKVNCVTAPPDELFISRVDGDQSWGQASVKPLEASVENSSPSSLYVILRNDTMFVFFTMLIG